MIALLAVFATEAAIADTVSGDGWWGEVEDAVEEVSATTFGVMDDDSAIFWRDKIRYEVYAVPLPETDVRTVLEGAIDELAHGIAIECFFQLTIGTVDDAGAAGLGDPASAIPSGYEVVDSELAYYPLPDASCNVEVELDLPLSLEAVYANAAGKRIWLEADRVDSKPAEPGLLSSLDGTWYSEGVAYNLSFEEAQSSGLTAVTALAAALDPAFDEGCQRREATLATNELATYGLVEPQALSGFSLDRVSRVAYLPLGTCTDRASDPGDFILEWIYYSTATDQLLEIRARKGWVTGFTGRSSVEVGEDYVRWMDDDSIAYSVYGHAREDGPGVSLEDLETVAKTVDPEFTLPGGP